MADKVFSMMDSDGSGTVNGDEFKEMIIQVVNSSSSSSGKKVDPERIEKLVTQEI